MYNSYRRITLFLRHTTVVREVYNTPVMHILTENFISLRFINANRTVAVTSPGSGSAPLAFYASVGNGCLYLPSFFMVIDCLTAGWSLCTLCL